MIAIHQVIRFAVGRPMTAAALAACAGAWSVAAFPATASCDNPPVANVSSPVMPSDVCIPDGFGALPIAFFDDFSWRTFVAMVWPVKDGERGVADTTKKVSDAGPRVFETFKADWEVFRPNGAEPLEWNALETSSPCGTNPVSFGDVVLASFSKFGNLGEAGGGPMGKLIHALPAQNKTWVRYSTGFNRLEFDQIRNGKLYLRSGLANPVTFKDGAVDIKAAWMDMSKVPTPERYYVRKALVADPVTNACTSMTVGLVGLHIVTKTASRPQWIWSSFEHVDNVPPQSAGAMHLSFNNGDGTGLPAVDPNGGFPPKDWAAPVLYNVAREKTIHPSTADTNARYQKAIGGPWAFYKLVVTQWPVPQQPPAPIPPTQSGAPKFTFPGLGATTSFANTVLETWEQSKVTTSCMACHETVRVKTDFLWGLAIHAFDPPGPDSFSLPPAGSGKPTVKPLSPELKQLQKILSQAERDRAGRNR